MLHSDLKILKIKLYKLVKIFSILIILSGFLFPLELIFSQSRIAILYSELTEKSDIKNSKEIIDVITSWELFLMQDIIPYSVIYEDDLESGIEDEFDILILPSVESISQDQMEALQKFLGNGNSIISCGSVLSFQEKKVNEYQNLETLFGLSDFETVPSENLSYLHSLVPNHLNHFNLDSELILQISNTNPGLICNSDLNKVLLCGYIFNDNNFNSAKSSIIYGKYGNGKFFCSGFDLNDVIGGKEDLLAFKNLILDAINWMDNTPDTYIEVFCDSLSSPVIMTLQYNNAIDSELVDVLQKNNIRPNLIVNSDQKVSKPILSKFTSEEIILEMALNSNITVKDVNAIIDDFNRSNEVSISTILVEKQYFENYDMDIISSAGINKIFYYEQANGLPQYARKDLLLIPFVRTNELPFSVNVINYLNYIPKIDCKGNPEDELLAKINNIKSYKYNFISLSSLNKWWKIKERITSEIKNIAVNEMEMWINNKNPFVIDDLNVYLSHVENIDKKTLTISLNNKLLKYNIDDTSGTIVIRLENILPNTMNKIKINFTRE